MPALVNGEKTSVETVADILETSRRRFPDRVAVKSKDGAQRTYRDLDTRTTRLANGLIGAGLSPGDRICAWLPDSVEYVELYLAAAKAGLVVVPINARLVAAEAEFIISDANPSMLFWSAALDEQVAAIPDAYKALGVAVGTSAIRADLSFEDLIAKGTSTAPKPPSPEDLYILGYTSGTTGRPKGAMLTHRSTLAGGLLNAFSLRFSGHTVHALTGSMSFVSVVPAHILSVLRMGGTIIMMQRWDVEDLIGVIERERATFTYLPSPILAGFATAAARRPSAIASLNAVVHSASRGNPDAIRAVRDVIGAEKFIEAWGMTEHSGAAVSATVPEDALIDSDRALTSVGRPTVHAAVRLIDADGNDLPWDDDTVGELAVSSPALMSGYWHNAAATSTALVNGWYRTGDLGTLDPAGYITIHERRTDLIISGGMNVYPSEVEQCIAQLDAVRDVCVVDEPHERWGQSVVAVVVKQPGSELTEDGVIAHCRRFMAGYKKPNRIVFVSELPKTVSQKTARGKVRESVRSLEPRLSLECGSLGGQYGASRR
jgi:acyl-CoA synthetase (AMP-forming)/AMP-acid ligase II